MEPSGTDAPAGRLVRLHLYLDGLSTARVLVIACVVLAGCALLDQMTGRELSFSIAYLAPTALAAWYAGRAAGFAMAVIASLAWLAVDLLSGAVYSHPLIPLWNSLVRLGFFLIVTALLLAIHKLLARLQEHAASDSLTGLANSRNFYARLELERERALRYQHPFTLAYLDLDNFKQVNDSWGHEAGDRVLQEIARLLTGGLRRTDLVARLGGDEFAILLAETGEREAAEALRKLHARLLQEMAAKDWPVGCSVGAVCCHDPVLYGARDLMRWADALMYRVKRSGKNRVELEVATQTAA